MRVLVRMPGNGPRQLKANAIYVVAFFKISTNGAHFYLEVPLTDLYISYEWAEKWHISATGLMGGSAFQIPLPLSVHYTSHTIEACICGRKH